MAICFSSLTLPIYRLFKKIGLKKVRTLPKTKTFSRKLYKTLPFYLYSITLIFSLIIPSAILCLLVAPQASLGFQQLKNIQLFSKLHNLVPEQVQHVVDSYLPSLADYPALESVINDIMQNADEYFNTFLNNIFAPAALWQRAVGFLGGSFTVLWTLFLFLVLTLLFTLYAKQARIITCSILQMPFTIVKRFSDAIRKALNAIMLGIVVVALMQGCLCGIGFAFAGIESFAFFGLLAAFVAPIPLVGTLLVWGPLVIVLWLKGSHFAAVGLLIWGSLVVTGVDNICRPLFLKQGIKAPFFVLILTMICGTSVLGPIGIIAGPVLLAASLQLIEESKNETLRQCYTKNGFCDRVQR